MILMLALNHYFIYLLDGEIKVVCLIATIIKRNLDIIGCDNKLMEVGRCIQRVVVARDHDINFNFREIP